MMSEERPGMSWQKILQNPQLFPALRNEDGCLPKLPWHSHADLANSSRVFCVSAFFSLTLLAVRDEVLNTLFSAAFPTMPDSARAAWSIELEKMDRALLGEGGPQQPTSIDVFCTSPSGVVCVESKFDRDAKDGFGGCCQARDGHCLGYYGPGSDAKTRGDDWCRLNAADGSRTPRHYWKLATGFFREDVFRKQQPADECPFKGPNFQLMRNFLFAEESAMSSGRPWFGMLVVAPERRAELVKRQVAAFREQVVAAPYRERVAFVPYETYTEAVAAQGADGAALADFLRRRLQILQ
jgi:hypothetical protein